MMLRYRRVRPKRLLIGLVLTASFITLTIYVTGGSTTFDRGPQVPKFERFVDDQAQVRPHTNKATAPNVTYPNATFSNTTISKSVSSKAIGPRTAMLKSSRRKSDNWKMGRTKMPNFVRVVDPNGKNLPLTSNQIKVSNEVKAYMKERRAKVEAVCAAHPGLSQALSNYSIMSADYHLFYCPVPKVASTFWSRFFHQLLYTYPVRSPFDVRVVDVMPSYFNKYKLKIKQISEIKKLISQYTRLLYVRDPFARIFSAFIDKMLAPNPILWERWGAVAKTRFRDIKTSFLQPEICGHDATFPEIVLLATTDRWHRDVHFEPVYVRCSPCLFNFTVIGKMETFTQDALHLLTLLNISETQIEFDKNEADAAHDAIDDSIKDSLSQSWMEKSLRCVSKEDVLRRILRKLQIRGFISWRYRLSLTADQIENMTYQEYTKLLVDARKIDQDKSELKLQKKQAFLEAFSLLTPAQFKTIWDVYGLDIDMFGTATDFTRTTDLSKLVKVNTDALDHTKDWDLSPVIGG